MVRYNEAVKKNADLKGSIDEARRQRLTYESIYLKLEAELEAKTEKMKQIIRERFVFSLTFSCSSLHLLQSVPCFLAAPLLLAYHFFPPILCGSLVLSPAFCRAFFLPGCIRPIQNFSLSSEILPPPRTPNTHTPH